MKIAYAQMKISAGHPDVNTEKILRLIDEARNQGADVVIFPSGAIEGELGFCADYECCEQEIIAASKGIAVILANNYQRKTIIKIFSDNTEDFWRQDFLIAKDGKFIDEKNFPLTVKYGADNKNLVGGADFYLKYHIGIKTAYGCPMIRVLGVGICNNGKKIFVNDGGSAVFNSRGEVVQYAEPFTESLNCIDLEKIDKMPALELPEVSETEKIYRTISFGVKNFLEQIGMKKVVVGVSGGIDSAVAAALYTKVVGAENVYLVNMPSKFNSSTTKNLSEQLAKNLGCKYFVVPIQESVDWTVKQLESVGFEVSSFVKENIQARDRSARILAAIAASVGGVFTCNANKAESTVGYATLYGDEAGFLSALADLWKYQVYDLARYMNEKIFGREVIPQGIIDIVPSAELSTAQNVDEGKGDPLRYDYHDYLFRAFVEKNLSPEEILNWYACGELEKNIGCAEGLVKKYFPTAEEFIADLERWWKAFKGMGVAKRLQSPPILAVTDCPYGSFQESQNGWHFTRKYLELKNNLLAR